MRSSTIIFVCLAIVFGGFSVFAGRTWLDRQAAARMRQIEAETVRKPVTTATIVVAKSPLRFGDVLAPGSLREMEWPAGETPPGAFATITELLGGEGRRLVLSAMEPNEPVLKGKISGNGQRGTLSAVLGEGMKAVTIRANDVMGVAGFILPGDRVDVIMTRAPREGMAIAELLLQNVRVLAVDQIADERIDKPQVVKALTLEVAIEHAQQVVLAAAVGNLQLALRRAGEAGISTVQRVSLEDLGSGAPASPPVEVAAAKSEPPVEAPATVAAPPAPPVVAPAPVVEPARRAVKIGVSRGLKREEYSVPPATAAAPPPPAPPRAALPALISGKPPKVAAAVN